MLEKIELIIFISIKKITLFFVIFINIISTDNMYSRNQRNLAIMIIATCIAYADLRCATIKLTS